MMVATPEHLLDKTVDVVTVTQASGGTQGEWTETTPTFLSGIKARIQPMNGSESVRYGRENNRRMFRVFVKPGQAITEDHRLTYTDTDSSTRTLDVVEVVEAQVAGVVLKLICEETD